MNIKAENLSPVNDAQAIVALIERQGLAYMHSSGCAVLGDGTWLQPEQWDTWLNIHGLFAEDSGARGEKGMDKVTETEAAKVVGSSASDCEIQMMGQADRNPLSALNAVAGALHYMNSKGVEKISHRRALVKAGRKALAEMEKI